MKMICIQASKSSYDVLVQISDPCRKGEKSVFYCPLSCIGDIVESNLQEY